MLRSTPSVTNRTSPPLTRSATRARGDSYVEPPDTTSTPVYRKMSQPRYIPTVERHFEKASDDDDEENMLEHNASVFVEKEHFNVRERIVMGWQRFSDWWSYSWRLFQRRFMPSLAQLCQFTFYLVLVAMFSKYMIDNHSAYYAQEGSQKLIEDIKTLKSNVAEISSNQQKLLAEIDDMRRLYAGKEISSEEYAMKIQELTRKLDGLHHDIEGVKTETRESVQILSEKTKKIEQTGPPAPPVDTKVADTSVVLPSSPIRRNLGANVANSLLGATIDERCSSRAVSAKDGIFFDMISYVMSFKEGYVLLEREGLMPGEAWCTYDTHPSLTINLARHVLPTAVSYQHVKWSGLVPVHAPKIFDVVACRNPCCTENTPLVTNCEYKESGHGEDVQEQYCYIENNDNIAPVNHVQFRFKENHGNMSKTCAYLVRVFGHPVNVPIEKSEKSTNAGESSNIISNYLPKFSYFSE